MASSTHRIVHFHQRSGTHHIVAHHAAMRRQTAALIGSLVATVPPLLLKTLLVFGGRTTEGRLVEAVAVPWLEIIKLLKNDWDLAFQIPPDKWEELIAGAYKKAGFDDVILTPRSGDRGRDVIAVKLGTGFVRVIDSVKAYRPPHLVEADDVRALVGVLHGDDASKGFLTTTSDFAPRLKDDPLIRPFIPSRLGLISGTELMPRLEVLAAKRDPQG